MVPFEQYDQWWKIGILMWSLNGIGENAGIPESIKCKLTQGKSKATVLVTHLRPDLLESALEISSMDLVSHLVTFALTNISDCKMSLNDCTPRGDTFWNWIGETRSTFRAKAWPASLTNCMMHLHDVRKAIMWLCETVAIWFYFPTQEIWNAILSDREITDRLNQLN